MFGWSRSRTLGPQIIISGSVDLSDPVIADVMNAWRAAYAAIDNVCSEFAALPGASQQYVALCKLSKEFQEAGRAEIEKGIGLAQKLGSNSGE